MSAMWCWAFRRSTAMSTTPDLPRPISARSSAAMATGSPREHSR
ncbi:hypothetical protein NC652_030376 [Populus alba x Populus x berolinensis]|nr:hypothetical protein NC652_030376 [Populus alba x Populus x berolinensis]